MKKALVITSILSIVSVLGITTSSTPAQAAPKSYVLMCKGGAGMSLDYRSTGDTLIINFKAGTSSGENGVSSGSCTWVDRGFRSGEPKRLCQYGVNDLRFIMNSRNKVTRLTSAKAPYVKKIRSGRSFQVRAYNNGSCMKVTNPGV